MQKVDYVTLEYVVIQSKNTQANYRMVVRLTTRKVHLRLEKLSAQK